MDFKTEFKNYMNIYEQKGGIGKNCDPNKTRINLKEVKLPPLIILKNNSPDKNNKKKIYTKLDKYIFEDDKETNDPELIHSDSENDSLSENILNKYRKYHIQLSDTEDSYSGDDISSNVGMQIAASN